MGSLTEDGNPLGDDHCDICTSYRTGRAKPRNRSCTSLLFDPHWTLGRSERWPDHLCYDDFMQRSIEVWVFQAVGQITSATKLWAQCYPLPIGVVAAKRVYTERGQNYPDELTEFLPFRGTEEAYWGLRVGEKRSVLDMFGLKSPMGMVPPDEDPEEILWLGSFAYSLRGRDDTSLLRLVEDGATWWRDFSLERVQGRPRGSGTWESREHLERRLIWARRKLRADERKVTQEAIATLLDPNDTDGRKLRRSMSHFGLCWLKVKKGL
jgi:hypothetical protein